MPKEKQLSTRPGIEAEMTDKPKAEKDSHRGSGKLANKVAIVTGGDSGIGRAVAIAFAKEGADIAVMYLNEHEDAQETERLVKEKGRRCLLIAGDVGDESFCRESVRKIVEQFGKLDVVVNNAAEQHPQDTIEKISQRAVRAHLPH